VRQAVAAFLLAVAVFLVSRFGLGVLAGLRRAIVSACEPGSGFGWNSLSDKAQKWDAC